MTMSNINTYYDFNFSSFNASSARKDESFTNLEKKINTYE